MRYSIRSEPLISGNCQCRTCRRASAVAIVPRLTVSSEHFVFSAGRPTEYNSSLQATRTFWGRCGTPLTYWLPSCEGKKIDVTIERVGFGKKKRNPGSAEMGRQVAVVLYVVAMAAVIVVVDFAFFRNRFWERLTVNIGIVLVFAAFYLRFLRRRMNKAR